MAEDHERDHTVPSDLAQIPIVWRYEVLKYLRSWRLLATLAVVALILAMIYLIPPLAGSPYAGTDTDTQLYFVDAGGGDLGQMALINRTVVVDDSVEVFLEGEAYPSMDGLNWMFVSEDVGGATANSIMFTSAVNVTLVTATYDWHVSAEGFDSNFIGFVSILIIICATLFAADSLAGEFQNKTGYLLFPNAVKRSTLFVGKFAASASMGLLILGLFYGVLAVLSFISVRGVDDDFLLSFLFAVEYMLAASAIAYFISSLLKGTTGAIVLTFFLLFMILPIVDGMSMFSGVKIEASVTFAAGAISYVLLDPYPVDSTMDVGMGFTVHSFYPSPESAAVVMLVYMLVACALSMVLFKRKQLAG